VLDAAVPADSGRTEAFLICHTNSAVPLSDYPAAAVVWHQATPLNHTHLGAKSKWQRRSSQHPTQVHSATVLTLQTIFFIKLYHLYAFALLSITLCPANCVNRYQLLSSARQTFMQSRYDMNSDVQTISIFCVIYFFLCVFYLTS
jgi:hypothetical protein